MTTDLSDDYIMAPLLPEPCEPFRPIKKEKIDAEVEQKLTALNKKDKIEDSNSVVPMDVKTVEQVKSSKEILTELFGVFNAKPPLELLDDASLLQKVKKSKKHKRLKSESGADEPTSLKKKKKKEKKKEKHKAKDKERHRHRHRRDEHKKGERSSRDQLELCKHKIENHTRDKSELCTDYFRLQSHSKNRSRSPSLTKDVRIFDEISDISLSDEDTYIEEKAHNKKNSFIFRENGRKHSKFDAQFGGNNKFLDDKCRSERHDSKRYHRTRRWSRSRTRSKSKTIDTGIDKKRLLEIATKNAIAMLKEGRLPAFAKMSEAAKNKILQMVQKDGRSVEDLTNFCKKLSQDNGFSDIHWDNLEANKESSTKAFHHPFQLKDREPIMFNIRSVAVPVKPALNCQDKIKAITMQFPVSSGQHHRVSESWIPVTNNTQNSSVKQNVKLASSGAKAVPKNVFEKSISLKEQEPAFKPIDDHGTSKTQSNNEAKPDVQSTDTQSMTIVSLPVMASQSPNVSTQTLPPQPDVITSRLEAIRKLQDSPGSQSIAEVTDHSKINMSFWANSQQYPGQFTGNTGAHILNARELSSGPQVWARRDQMKTAKPLNGGIGMALLQKMGWKPGEGLGRERNGALQPLLLDVKLDKRGLVTNQENGYKPPIPVPHMDVPPSNKPEDCISSGKSNLCNSEMSKHPVSLLNELSYKHKWERPIYQIVDVLGPMHNCFFKCSVTVNGLMYTPDAASSTKKESRLNAAKLCLQNLGIPVD